MLHSDQSYRFTAPEVASSRQAGLDLQGVTTPDAFAAALEPWLYALAEVRPELFDRIAQAVSAASGGSLPPRLSVVSSVPTPDCPD
jgi:hypothetical protein